MRVKGTVELADVEANWLIFCKHFKEKSQPESKKGPKKQDSVDEERGSSDFEIATRPGSAYLVAEDKRARDLFDANLAPAFLERRLSRSKNFFITQRRMSRSLLSYGELHDSRLWKASWSGSCFQIEKFEATNNAKNLKQQIEKFPALNEQIQKLQLNLDSTLPSQHIASPLAPNTELLAIGTTLSGHLEVKGIDQLQEQLVAIVPWPLFGSPHPLSYHYRAKMLKPSGSTRKDGIVEDDNEDDDEEEGREKDNAANARVSNEDVPPLYRTMRDEHMPSPTLGIPSALYISPAAGYREKPCDFAWLNGLWDLPHAPASKNSKILLPLHRILCIAVDCDVQVWRISMKSDWTPNLPSPNTNSFTRAQYASLGLFEGKEGKTVSQSCNSEVTPLDASLLFTFTPIPNKTINKLISWTHPLYPNRPCIFMAHDEGHISSFSFSLPESQSAPSWPIDWYDANFISGSISVQREFVMRVGEVFKKRSSAPSLRPSRLLAHIPASKIAVLAVPEDRGSSQASTMQISLLLTVHTAVLSFDLSSILLAQDQASSAESSSMDIDGDDNGSLGSSTTSYPLVAPFCSASVHVMAISDLHAFCLPVEIATDGPPNGSHHPSPSSSSSIFSGLRPFSTPIQGLTTGLDGVYRGWRLEPQKPSQDVPRSASTPTPHLLASSLYPQLAPKPPGARQPGAWKFVLLSESDIRSLVEEDEIGAIHADDDDEVFNASGSGGRRDIQVPTNASSSSVHSGSSGSNMNLGPIAHSSQSSSVGRSRARDLKKLIASEEWPSKRNSSERGFLLSIRDAGSLDALMGLHVTTSASYVWLVAATSGRFAGNFASLILSKIDSPASPPPLLPLLTSTPIPSTAAFSTLPHNYSTASIESAAVLRSEPLPLVLRSISALLSPLSLSQLLNINLDHNKGEGMQVDGTNAGGSVRASDFYRLIFPSFLQSFFPLPTAFEKQLMPWDAHLWDRIAASSRVVTEWLRERITGLPLEKIDNSSIDTHCAQKILEQCNIAIGDLTMNGKKKKRKMGFSTPRRSSLSSSGNVRSPKGNSSEQGKKGDSSEMNVESALPRPLLSSLLLLALRLRSLCLLRHISVSLHRLEQYLAKPDEGFSPTALATLTPAFPPSLDSSKKLKAISVADRHVLSHWAVMASDLISSPLWLDDRQPNGVTGAESLSPLLPPFVKSLGGDILKLLQKSVVPSSPASSAFKTMDSLIAAKQEGFKDCIGVVGGEQGLKTLLKRDLSSEPSFPLPTSLSALIPLDTPQTCGLCMNESPASSPNGAVAMESALALSVLFASPSASFMEVWCPHDGARLAYCASSGLGLPSLDLFEEETHRNVSKTCPVCSASMLGHSPSSSLPPWVVDQCPFCLV